VAVDTAALYKTRFGVPRRGLGMTAFAAMAVTLGRAASASSEGSRASVRATTPVTCGVAMLVPLFSSEHTRLELHAESTSTPGAWMFTQGP